jgi:hypothetical protein
MKEIVLRYVKRNFRFILTGLTSLYIFDLSTGKRMNPGDMIEELITIFGEISYDEAFDIVGPWFTSEMTRVQNKIVDLQYDMYAELNKEPSLRITEASEPLAYTDLSAYLPSIEWLMSVDEENRIQYLNELFGDGN